MSSEGGGASKRKIRGPRSQRNRKRARPEQTIEYNVSIRPLALNDVRIDPITYVRTIEPYPYTFSTFAKARWIGTSVLDVYCSEFGSYPPTYYRAAIQQGRIRVSDKQVPLDYKIKGNDVLSHTVHRHEPGVVVAGPVSPIRIVAETADLLVVDKPSTLPVHPCGAYQQNSLLPILEPTFGKLHIIHRLDRLTSGLVLLAKNSTVAQTWGKALMERNTCTKVYVARVKGKFPTQCPSNLKRLDVPVQYGVFQSTSTTTTESDPGSIDVLRAANALGCWITDTATGEVLPACAVTDLFSSHQSIDEWIDDPTQGTNPKSTGARWFHMACPTRIANHKDGICEAGSFQDLSDDMYLKSVKPAQTSFGVVRYDVDTDSTIVVCRPQTGRTHQIRLHLQYLGHPIANDPCYGGEIWYGNDKGRLECQEAASILEKLNSAAASPSGTNADATDGSSNNNSSSSDEVATISDTPATEAEIEQLAQLVRDENEPLEEFYKKTCVWCARSAGTDRTMLELLVRSRGIWLHALKYRMMDAKGTELSYRTDVPSWS